MKLKQEIIYNLNIDYLDVYWSFINAEQLFIGLDTDNSCIRQFWEFTLFKTEAPNYSYKIVFLKSNTPVMAYYVGKKLSDVVTTKNHFLVYGSAYAFFETEFILDFIAINVDIVSIRRLDIAMDLKIRLHDLLKRFKTMQLKDWVFNFKCKWWVITDKQGNIQTYYIWAKKLEDNKNLLIRLYDKIADIKAKDKQALYPEYLQEESISRVECEFRQWLCEWIQFSDLYSSEFIKQLFTSYISKHSDYFDYKWFEKISVFKRKKWVLITDLTNEQILKERTLSMFRWLARNMLSIWVCPVTDLVNHDILWQNTIKMLLNCKEGESVDLLKFALDTF